MHQTLLEHHASRLRNGDERTCRFATGMARRLQRLAALVWGALGMCVFAVDANVQMLDGRNAIVQPYLGKQAEKLVPMSDNSLTSIEPAAGLRQAPFFTASESTQCREKPYRFCRDLAQTEFRLTSLRFMVPEVPGLAPKSLTIRRNSVIANYTFR